MHQKYEEEAHRIYARRRIKIVETDSNLRFYGKNMA